MNCEPNLYTKCRQNIRPSRFRAILAFFSLVVPCLRPTID